MVIGVSFSVSALGSEDGLMLTGGFGTKIETFDMQA